MCSCYNHILFIFMLFLLSPELTAKCENVTCEALDEECTKVIHFSDECCPRCVLTGAEGKPPL